MALIARLELVPPPHAHRGRYCGVLVSNSPLLTAAVALASGQSSGTGTAQPELGDVSTQLAGCRCGTAAMRRWAMVLRWSPIGRRRPNWRQTLRLISVSVGQVRQQRYGQRCGAGLRLALNKRSGRRSLKACDVQSPGHKSTHAVGFPILGLARISVSSGSRSRSAQATALTVHIWCNRSFHATAYF